MRIAFVAGFAPGVPMNPPGYWSDAIAKLRKLFGGVCQWEGCTETMGLQFAHVVTTGLSGRGRGMPRRVTDIRRYPERYRLWCRAHHLEFDRTKGPSLPDEAPF